MLAVDKRMTRKDGGIDLDLSRVALDLPYMGYQHPRNSGENFAELSDSQILILTNARKAKLRGCTTDRLAVSDDGLLWNTDNHDDRIVETTYCPGGTPAQPNYFSPETWMFNSFEYNPKGNHFELATTAPRSTSSFVVSGFALHPELGLAIADPVEIKVLINTPISFPYRKAKGSG